MNKANKFDQTGISFEKLAETSPITITRVDRDGKIVYANNRAEDILGLAKSDITDRTYEDPGWKITDYEGNDFPSENLPFQIVKRTKEPVYDVRHAIEWPNGERKLLSINASPLFDDERRFDGMVSVIEDITERVKKEEKLSESEERFRRVYENISAGVAKVSLDFRIESANPA